MSTDAIHARSEDDAYDAFLGRKYFNALDGLRAVSVVAVIWHHTGGAQMTGLLNRGDLGVDFFFAISGFLITTLLLREYRATGRINLPQFYLRRTLRIFPLYYATIILYVVLTLATQRNTPEGQQFLSNLPAFVTYTSNWFVTDPRETFFLAWSLATEEQFYLFWPACLVAVLALTRGRTWPATIVIAVLLVADVLASSAGDHESLTLRILSSIATPICVGAALAIFLNMRKGFATLGLPLRWRFSGVALLALTIAMMATGVNHMVIGVVMALAVAAYCVTELQVGKSFLASRPLRFVGAISYGMYLLHVLVMNGVERVLHLQQSPPLFLATTVFTIVVAWVSFRYFETPIRKIGRRRQAVGTNSASVTM